MSEEESESRPGSSPAEAAVDPPRKKARKTARKTARDSSAEPERSPGDRDDPPPEPSSGAGRPARSAPGDGGQAKAEEGVSSPPPPEGKTGESPDAGFRSSGGPGNGRSAGQGQNRNNRKKKKRKGKFEKGGGAGGGPRRASPFSAGGVPVEVDPYLDLGQLNEDELLQDLEALEESQAKLFDASLPPVRFNDLYELPLQELRERARRLKLDLENAPSRPLILREMLRHFEEKRNPVLVEGCLEVLDDGFGMVVFPSDSYRLRSLCPYVSEALVEHHGLQRGHTVEVFVQAPREGESCPVVLSLRSVMGGETAALEKVTPFTELVPYYPLDRILLENSDEAPENNLSMRVVDLISPIGFGQRGLIVAPPRTGKTVLLQGIAHSVQLNYPEAHLIVLLVDERPEEVTDFRRRVRGEVISSTFDESAGSHVHAAEMVIEKSRRLVEAGRDVVILLDSITRLARAYNTLMPDRKSVV